jgi:hypothetical protein
MSTTKGVPLTNSVDNPGLYSYGISNVEGNVNLHAAH